LKTGQIQNENKACRGQSGALSILINYKSVGYIPTGQLPKKSQDHLPGERKKKNLEGNEPKKNHVLHLKEIVWEKQYSLFTNSFKNVGSLISLVFTGMGIHQNLRVHIGFPLFHPKFSAMIISPSISPLLHLFYFLLQKSHRMPYRFLHVHTILPSKADFDIVRGNTRSGYVAELFHVFPSPK